MSYYKIWLHFFDLSNQIFWECLPDPGNQFLLLSFKTQFSPRKTVFKKYNYTKHALLSQEKLNCPDKRNFQIQYVLQNDHNVTNGGADIWIKAAEKASPELAQRKCIGFRHYWKRKTRCTINVDICLAFYLSFIIIACLVFLSLCLF